MNVQIKWVYKDDFFFRKKLKSKKQLYLVFIIVRSEFWDK